MLALAPWKSAIVRRGLARRAGTGRWVSVAFGVLVLLAVAAGLAHATGALASLGPVSAMQVHVGAALATLPLLAWHAAARGGARPRRTDLSRRALLRPARSAPGPACCSWPSRAPPAWPACPGPAAASPAPCRSRPTRPGSR